MVEICDRVLDRVLTPQRPVSASTIVMVEGFAFGSRGRAAVSLGGLGWLVRANLYRRGIAYMDVPPAVLKKYVTGKGNAKKDVMMRDVYRRWGFEAPTTDEADAFALAMLGQTVLDAGSGRLTKADQAIVASLGECPLMIERKNR